MPHDSEVRGLRQQLRNARNPDGGWGYASGNTSRIEPTAWALLALARAEGRTVEIERLAGWPKDGPWLTDLAGAPINYAFNALAALTFLTATGSAVLAEDLARQLLVVRGRRFDQAPALRQDNSLQAWPWVDNTFSWVEPTSWCLLLTKKMRARLGPAAGDRIRVGEAMLRDRACATGGWNYGSSFVYGQELLPYPATTALGVLAMQDQLGDPVVKRALDLLQQGAASEPSSTGLALTVIALRACRMPVTAPAALLADRVRRSPVTASTLDLAMDLYSLVDSPDGETVFAI
jgi:hypothetical protein